MRGVAATTGLALAVTAGVLLLRAPHEDPGGRAAGEVKRRVEQARARGHKAFDQPAVAAAFYLAKRVADGETLPVELLLAGVAHSRAMRVHSSVAGRQLERAELRRRGHLLAWEALGPGNIGGRTRALAFDPANPATIYAGGVAGGIWKSTDSGQTWRALDDFLPSLAVSTLVVDPADPRTLYAGSGEGFYNADGVRGAGIFKTTDAGRTWLRLANTATSDFYYVNKLALGPGSPATLYAATRTGLFRSTDGGASWGSQLANPGQAGRGAASAGSTSTGFVDVAVHPTTRPDLILAASGSFSSDAVYRSTDGGDTWAPVLDAASTGVTIGRTTLAFARSNPAIVYASSADPDGAAAGLFRSTDAGLTWAIRHRGNTNSPRLNWFDNVCVSGSNQGWYDNALAVDPVNPNRLWLGGIDLFRSDDGGSTIHHAGYWFLLPKVFKSYIHADHHTIVFHPRYDGSSNTTVFFGNDGGVYKTNNPAASTDDSYDCNIFGLAGVQYTEMNIDYGVTQFYHGVPFPDGTKYFGGTQDNGTVLGDDALGPNKWRYVWVGDGGYVAVNPANTTILYAENTGISIRKSTDSGDSFILSTQGIDDSGLFITPFAMDPSDPDTLWLGGTQPWRTTDAAATWVRPGSFTGTSKVTAIAVAPADRQVVMMGLTNGRIYRAANALAASPTWDNITNPARSDWVSWLTIDPEDPAVAYATYSRFGGQHLHRTTDAGRTWVALDGKGTDALPDIPAHTVVRHPRHRDWLYVGTDLGVYVSLGGGGTWMVENTGFANAVTEALAFQPGGTETRLYAFTHGRGAYRAAIAEDLPVPAAAPLAALVLPALAGARLRRRGLTVQSPPGAAPMSSPVRRRLARHQGPAETQRRAILTRPPALDRLERAEGGGRAGAPAGAASQDA